MAYTAVLRRNRQNRTNYRKRLALLVGRVPFVSITVSNQNVMAQVLKSGAAGDEVVTGVHSRELINYGWKGSMNSIPSCYLTGLLLGTRSLDRGMNNLVLYTGKGSFTSRVAACLKGVMDAGIRIPVSKDSLPKIERLSGGHIARYAELLKKDEKNYNLHFSSLLKNGFVPENYPQYFEEVKMRIIQNVKAAMNNRPATKGANASLIGEQK